MIVYVIAARAWKGDNYRTRYYVECVDGRPRLGEKCDASCFGEESAAQVCGQLNQLDAYTEFFVMNFADRPPRFKELAPSPGIKPEQVDAFEVKP